MMRVDDASPTTRGRGEAMVGGHFERVKGQAAQTAGRPIGNRLPRESIERAGQPLSVVRKFASTQPWAPLYDTPT